AFVGDGSSLTGVVATMGLNDLTDAVRNSESIYIGLNAGDNHNPAAQQNVAIGEYAMANAPDADANVAIGYKALGYANGKDNNISIGKHSSRYIQGNENIAIGRDAGYGQSSADVNRNIFIGKESGFSVDTGANDNTFLGHRTGYAVSTGANNILIGSGVETSAPTSSNELNIGNIIYGVDISSTIAKVGINTPNPTESLEVSGTVSATAFVGDGSGLTGVGGLWTDAGDYITRDGFRVYAPSTTIDLTNGDSVAFWDEEKAAFRAGHVNFNDWDDSQIGDNSTAFAGGRASGTSSFAWGAQSVTAGQADLALGAGAQTSGTNYWKMAIGVNSRATFSPGNTAIGPYAKAEGGSANYSSFAVGPFATARNGRYNIAIGRYTLAETGYENMAVGHGATVSGARSLSLGYGGIVSGDDSMMIGVGADASGTTVANNNTLAIMGASGGVGIGTVAPTAPLEVSGTAKATEFVVTSDRTFKENIQPLKGALELVNQLQGVSYKFKSETGMTQKLQIGLIAQDVAEVYPQVVNGKEGQMSVNYAALVSPLIEAVKDLNGKLEKQQELIDQQQKLIEKLMEDK
ncbi:MAG: tail fiber domain-containing protein, partial [Pseudomonadota bacterium]|nr:tail fiber domain-containing protein [Pseudomonadota bacterium]